MVARRHDVKSPPHRSKMLSELTDGELRGMIEGEDETLFVEHKANLDGEGWNVAKAIASFANTLGGWVLVGVADNAVGTWTFDGQEGFVDRVRELAVAPRIGPMPSFSAMVRKLDEGEVGVIRVYESSDTPHILSDGTVVIREPARDSNVRAKGGRYAATSIKSHFALLELTDRGGRAAEAAEDRLDPARTPLVSNALNLEEPPPETAFVLRLTPLTGLDRFATWALSQRATDAVRTMAAAAVGSPNTVSDPEFSERGVICRAMNAATARWFLTQREHTSVRPHATAVIDAAGVLGLRLEWTATEMAGDPDDRYELTVDRVVADILDPLAMAAVGALQSEGLVGRYAAHLLAVRLARTITGTGGTTEARNPPGRLPQGGEIVIPAADEDGPDPELEALMQAWAVGIGRGFGQELYG